MSAEVSHRASESEGPSSVAISTASPLPSRPTLAAPEIIDVHVVTIAAQIPAVPLRPVAGGANTTGPHENKSSRDCVPNASVVTLFNEPCSPTLESLAMPVSVAPRASQPSASMPKQRPVIHCIRFTEVTASRYRRDDWTTRVRFVVDWLLFAVLWYGVAADVYVLIHLSSAMHTESLEVAFTISAVLHWMAMLYEVYKAKVYYSTDIIADSLMHPMARFARFCFNYDLYCLFRMVLSSMKWSHWIAETAHNLLQSWSLLLVNLVQFVIQIVALTYAGISVTTTAVLVLKTVLIGCQLLLLKAVILYYPVYMCCLRQKYDNTMTLSSFVEYKYRKRICDLLQMGEHSKQTTAVIV